MAICPISRTASKGFVPYLDLSFGAGLTADRADHVTAVHMHQFVIQTEKTLMPGANVDVVINTRLHLLEVLNLVPDIG